MDSQDQDFRYFVPVYGKTIVLSYYMFIVLCGFAALGLLSFFLLLFSVWE